MQKTEEIKALAQKYETADFINADPSWFMHQVEGRRNQETMAFIASCFSYGSRKQFMPKIKALLDASKDSAGNPQPYEWIASGRFRQAIPANDSCFYRLYTNNMVRDLFERLYECLNLHGSMKDMVKKSVRQGDAFSAVETLVRNFGGKIVPRSTSSSCKRLCMLLRWLVRDNSPVDIGIWADIIDKRTLIMPLDTHVMQQANRLGLISTKTTSMATALKLTKAVANIFPDDPLKADFALFGVGINRL